ncbi:MAG: UDP-3-O-(3-hydroxymyristoyl)glucosamine N-acyltransferase [Candidatus Omnitrophica bacterium]|nr:UDP-3-O-(3-hydroxymyristoyl)glucosamine N-acyltransferase [Candidatus Omnitrophota bacterium]
MVRVSEIAQRLKGEVIGAPDIEIRGVNGFELAEPDELTFAEKDYLSRLGETRAACVIVPKEFKGPSSKTLVKVANPKEAFLAVIYFFYKPEKYLPGIDPRAVIGQRVKLGENVTVSPCAVIGDDAQIGDRTVIEAGAVVGKRVKVGSDTIIYANVTLYHDVRIGNRVTIHSGTVIGSDGFGFVEKDSIQIKVPQTGTVVIEDDVEIGSNVSVDRATFGATVIGKGTKLDNIIQIAHNCQIGKNVLIAGQSGMAGGAIIEDNVVIAAQVGIKDHVRIGKRAVIGAKSAVKDDVPPGVTYIGIPAKDARIVAKEWAILSRLAKKRDKGK